MKTFFFANIPWNYWNRCYMKDAVWALEQWLIQSQPESRPMTALKNGFLLRCLDVPIGLTAI